MGEGPGLAANSLCQICSRHSGIVTDKIQDSLHGEETSVAAHGFIDAVGELQDGIPGFQKDRRVFNIGRVALPA